MALNDPDEFVRERAADALGRIGDARASGALQHALNDKDNDVRTTAEEALEKIKRRNRNQDGSP
jgi:HEAT repeat protein